MVVPSSSRTGRQLHINQIGDPSARTYMVSVSSWPGSPSRALARCRANSILPCSSCTS